MIKKVLAVVLALVMILACTGSAFAVVYGSPGSYVQGSGTSISGTFNVKLNIQGYKIHSGSNTTTGPIEEFYLNVSMGATGVSKVYTVKDVLDAAAIQYSSILEFDINSDDDHSSYLHGIKDVDSSTWFVSGAMKNGTSTYYTGWMFRINGQIPMINTTKAALINEAYISQNDVIDVYYANTYDQSYATAFTQIIYDGLTDSGARRFRLLYTECYVSGGGYYNWVISQYDKAANLPITVVIDGQSFSVTTNNNGRFNVSGLSTGVTHTMEIRVNAYNIFTDPIDSTITYSVPDVLNTYSTFVFN